MLKGRIQPTVKSTSGNKTDSQNNELVKLLKSTEVFILTSSRKKKLKKHQINFAY